MMTRSDMEPSRIGRACRCPNGDAKLYGGVPPQALEDAGGKTGTAFTKPDKNQTNISV
jgi:hypothetical protein